MHLELIYAKPDVTLRGGHCACGGAGLARHRSSAAPAEPTIHASDAGSGTGTPADFPNASSTAQSDADS